MIRQHVDETSSRSKELIEDQAKQRPHVHLVRRVLEYDAQCSEGLLERLGILSQHLRVKLIKRLQHKVFEPPLGPRRRGFGELARLGMEVDVAPEAHGELVQVHGTVSVGVHLGEGFEGEAPAHLSRGERDVALLGRDAEGGVGVDLAVVRW